MSTLIPTITTENISKRSIPRISSVITEDVSNANSSQPQKVNYREEIISLFFDSLLKYVVDEYVVTTEPDHGKTNEDEEASITEVKDFRGLSREDLQNSQISNVSGSKVSLTQRPKRSFESRNSIRQRLRSKQSQDKGKRSSLSPIKTDSSLKRSNASKIGKRVFTLPSISTIPEDTGTITEDTNVKNTADSWFVNASVEEVSINFKNGNSYRGSVWKKRFHGNGIFTWSDGAVYEGEFRDGCLSGRGKLGYSDNSYYIGDFCKGLLHGEGCMYVCSTSMLYSGTWKGGRKNGKGWLLYGFNNWYDGEWRDDLRQGVGVRHYDKHCCYQGNFHEGKRDGKGTMVWGNSDYYKGEWLNGTMSGYGKYVWKAFLNKTFTFPITNNYQGFWLRGMRNGKGLMYFGFRGGARMAGFWVNNMKHGPGIVICGNGTVVQKKPLFSYDKPVVVNLWGSMHSTSLKACGRKSRSATSSQRVSIAAISQRSESVLDMCPGVHKFVEMSDFPKKLSALMIPISIPVHFESEQIDLSYYLEKLLDVYKFSNPLGECQQDFDLSLQTVVYFEENKTRVALKRNYLFLQNLYHQYATIATSETVVFNCVLVRLFLWQMYYDSGISSKGFSIIDTDASLNDNPSSGVETDHHPFEQIFFWQFLLSLLGTAWEVYGEESLCSREQGVLATAFEKLLQDDILPNAGKLKGYLLCEYKDVLPIQSAYAFYTSIGEPHSVRLLLNFCLKYGLRNRCYEKLFEDDENMAHLPSGRNVTAVSENVIFLSDELNIGEKPEAKTLYPFEDDMARKNLHSFLRMKPRKLVRCMAKVCPVIMEDDVLVNLDYKLSFLEFLDILYLNAHTIISDIKMREIKIKEREERKKQNTEENLTKNVPSKVTKASKKGSAKEKKKKEK